MIPLYLTKNHAICIVEILIGEMSEWSMEAVLKTVGAQVSGGSNPSLSASLFPIRDDPYLIGGSLGEVRERPNRAPC